MTHLVEEDMCAREVHMEAIAIAKFHQIAYSPRVDLVCYRYIECNIHFQRCDKYIRLVELYANKDYNLTICMCTLGVSKDCSLRCHTCTMIYE